MTNDMDRRWQEEWRARSTAVLNAKTDDFVDLFLEAGLDAARHARFAKWSNVDFSGSNLGEFDFTGAKLDGCDFQGARLIGGGFSDTFSEEFARTSFARFEQAELARVIPPSDPHEPAEITPIAELKKAADWSDYCGAWKRTEHLSSDAHLPDGAIFQDCPYGPQLVVIPSGTFMMGPKDEPQRDVQIAYRFAAGRFPVTFTEYDSYRDATQKEKPADEGWGRDGRPVINVSWHDATAYAKWLSEKTGQPYRLLSEAEWEYSCRAGTVAQFSFGDDPDALAEHAWFTGNSDAKTHPVGEKLSNAFGLHDMHGNVWEWCSDAWHDIYDGAPIDGSAREGDDGVSRVLRGGSWVSIPDGLRAAYRGGDPPDDRDRSGGFRLARTLHP